MRRKKNDTLLTGFIGGAVLPILFFVGLYLIKYPDLKFLEYIEHLWFNGLMFKIMSVCVFPNLVLLLLYVRKKMDYAARGVVMATIIYALVVLISKVF